LAFPFLFTIKMLDSNHQELLAGSELKAISTDDTENKDNSFYVLLQVSKTTKFLNKFDKIEKVT